MKMQAYTAGFILLLVLTGCANPAGLSTPPMVVTETQSSNSVDAGDVGSVHPIGNMLTDRAAHAATLLENGEVLITGGFGQGDSAYRDSAELYDPTTGKFAFAGKMSVTRCCHTSTRLPDGRVLIAGGFNGEYLSGAEIYKPATGEFTSTGSLTTPRMDHVAVLPGLSLMRARMPEFEG